MADLLGLGTDILEIERFRASLAEHKEKFLHRLFTEKERAYCEKHQDAVIHFAGRFAAKEAIAKALGTGLGKELGWQDIEILPDPKGKPLILCSAKINQAFNNPSFLLSISHSRTMVVATALWISS